MKRTITHAVIAEAFKLGAIYFRPFDVRALAEVLQIPLIETLRLLSLNAARIQVDGAGRLGQIVVSTTAADNITLSELRAWFIEHVAKNGPVVDECSKDLLEKQNSGRVTYLNTTFNSCCCANLLDTRDLSYVQEKITRDYGPEVGKLVECLAIAKGMGLVVDKYIHGIPLTPATIAVMQRAGVHVFTAAGAEQARAASPSAIPAANLWQEYTFEVSDPAPSFDIPGYTPAKPGQKVPAHTAKTPQKKYFVPNVKRVANIKDSIRTDAGGAPTPLSPMSKPVNSMAEIDSILPNTAPPARVVSPTSQGNDLLRQLIDSASPPPPNQV